MSSLGRPEPSQSVARALVTYLERVDAWRRKINLTGAKTVESLVEVMVGDALMLASEEPVAPVPRGVRLVDVGAGAGAPTIPLLLLRPDVSACLVEPIGKRRAFLRSVIGKLGLEDRCEVDERHVDDQTVAHFTRFDVALSRATLPPGEWRALGQELAPRVLVLTAGSDLSEPAQFQVSYQLPSGAARKILVYEDPVG